MAIPGRDASIHYEDPLVPDDVPRWGRRKGKRIDPLVNTGRPSHMAAQDWRSSWGVLSYYDYPERNSLAPDLRTYIFPSAIGRGFPGRQQLNGVSQLDPCYQIPQRTQVVDASGKVVRSALPTPYWQNARAQVNPQQVQLFGGQAGEVPGPIQTQQWHWATYAGIPASGGPTGGPGTVSSTTGLRALFGF